MTVGFQNIELLTEKTLSYWVEGVKLLKKEFPDRIVIFSIMAAAKKEDWEVSQALRRIVLPSSTRFAVTESGAGSGELWS